jgi:hypothetical protein
MATLKWNAGVHNFMTYLTGDIPVGAYDPTRVSPISASVKAPSTAAEVTERGKLRHPTLPVQVVADQSAVMDGIPLDISAAPVVDDPQRSPWTWVPVL